MLVVDERRQGIRHPLVDGTVEVKDVLPVEHAPEAAQLLKPRLADVYGTPTLAVAVGDAVVIYVARQVVELGIVAQQVVELIENDLIAEIHIVLSQQLGKELVNVPAQLRGHLFDVVRRYRQRLSAVARHVAVDFCHQLLGEVPFGEVNNIVEHE